MTNDDDLGCGHCGRPLDLCDCGVDYELVYRPQSEDFRYRAQIDWSARGWLVLVAGLGIVMVLRMIVLGWS